MNKESVTTNKSITLISKYKAIKFVEIRVTQNVSGFAVAVKSITGAVRFRSALSSLQNFSYMPGTFSCHMICPKLKLELASACYITVPSLEGCFTQGAVKMSKKSIQKPKPSTWRLNC